MATYTDAITVVSSGLIKKIGSSDILNVTGGFESTPIGQNGNAAAGTFTTFGTTGLATLDSLTVTNNAIVSGNLTVSGTLTTNVSNEVLIGDSFINLNAGYTTNSGQQSGLVLNYLPTATGDTAAAGGFASTSTLTTTGSATFSAGDIIQISSADNASNNGLYEVTSHIGTTLTIDTTPSLSFSKDAFVVDTGDTNAVVTKVTLRTIFTNASGTLQTGAGATVTDYNSSITTLSTGNPTQIANGGADVSLDGSGNLSTTSLGTMALSSTGASSITTTSGNLTVSTATSGNLTISSAGTLGVTGAGASTFGDGVATWDFDGAGALSTSGMTTVDLDCSGALSLNSSGGAINVGNDAVAQAINVGTGAAARTITVGNTTGATAVNLDAGTGGIVGEVQDSQAAAFSVGISGGSKNVALSTLNNAFAVTGVALALQNKDGSSPVAQSYGNVSAGAYTQHHLLRINATAGTVTTFDAENGDNVLGTALLASSGSSQPVIVGIGGIVNVVFGSAPAASAIGSIVYAAGGAAAGEATLTAPTASGARVWKVGILVAADGSATTTQIQWQPQFLYDVP
jgi:hypothetical protein